MNDESLRRNLGRSMRCFEIGIVISETRDFGHPHVSADQLTYGIPAEAQGILEPILGQYGQVHCSTSTS